MPSHFANARAFAHVVERAHPGASIPYHTGHLACDAQVDGVAHEVGRMALRLSVGSVRIDPHSTSMEYGMGVGTLAQRKVGPGLYQYIFIKSRRAR